MTHRDPTLPFIPPTLDERRLDALGKLVDILEQERGGRPLTRGETLLVHAALGFHDAIERILESDTRPAPGKAPRKVEFAKPLTETDTPGTGCPPHHRRRIDRLLAEAGKEETDE